MVLSDSFYYQPVQIDTINTRVNADLFAKEGDANGRGMVVQITENGIIKDTTGITLRLQWSHISVGTSGFTDFEVVDATKGLYKLIYPTSMLHRGRVEAFIRITDNGILSGTRNLLITVERMVGSDETIEAADDFSALQTALTTLNIWDATISGKVDTWGADMEATKQLYIDTLTAAEAAYPQELVSLQGQLADKATKTELQAVASGSPKGVYATLSALQSAKPTGDTNIYLVTADGKWYYWSGSAWTAGGTYQSTGIADGSVSYKKVDNSVSTKFINLESEQPLSVSGGSLVRNGSEYVYTSSHSGFYVAFYDFDEHVSDGDKVVIAFDVKSSNLALDRRVRLRILNGGIDILPSDFFIGRDYVRYFYVFDITSAIADQTTHLSLSWYTPTVGNNFCLDNVMIINTGTKYTTDEINSIDWKSVAYSSSVDVDTVLKKYMSKLESDVATIKSKSTMEFKPPAKLDFIAGEKVELFDRGLVKSDMEKEKFLIEITLPSDSTLPSPQAKMHRNLLDFSGISSLSSNLYFWIRDIYGNQLTTSKSMLYKSVPFSVNPIPPNPATVKNILFCGDSLMSTGLITKKFKDKMAGYGLTNFNLVGRRFHTTVENRFEGLGGWAWRNYVDDPATLPISYPDNYFWDSAIGDINIKKYVDTYCGGVNLDYVVCELGMNHLVNSTNQGSDLTVVSAKAKHFIDKVHADYPSAKVILVGIHRFSDLYKYNQKKNRDFLFYLNDMYEAIAADSNYSSFVKFANVASMFDSKYGSQFITQSAGLFADTETEEYLIDYVHPNDKGYQMYADCISRKFITIV